MFLLRRKNANILKVILFSFPILFSFQNCGSPKITSSFGESNENSQGTSGDGRGGVPMPTPEPLPVPVAVGGKITDIQVVNKSATTQTQIPITFGQIFKKGALTSASHLAGKMSDGRLIPLQFNVKATHADKSVRHAIVTGIIPQLAAGQTELIELLNSSTSPGNGEGPLAQDLLAAGFSAEVRANIGGTVYSASTNSLLTSATKKVWLSGPISNEWILAAPLKTSGGVEHPHLMARFAVRAIAGQNRAKVDITIENGWAYEAAPQNFIYDASLLVGGQTVYSKPALNHFHHARWKKTFWWGTAPQVHLKHNAKYIIESRAVPNYDQSIPINLKTVEAWYTNLQGANSEPMKTGLAQRAMGTTGGRSDIGLNPAWSVAYLLSQDELAQKVALGMSDLAGSWSIHYRDKKTDRPLSIFDYPYATLLGNPGDTYNPATKQRESFPACGGVCSSDNSADGSHQPNFSYIPYMLSGEFYHLEELTFWASYNTFYSNPHYRQFSKGLVKSDQLRGQAWTLRTIADAAFILPDGDKIKNEMAQVIDTNLDYFNTTLTSNPEANKLGVATEGYTIVYANGRGLAPWQDDFFTQSIGHISELGFEKAKTLLTWKAKFVVGRMTDPGVCWIDAGIYSLMVRDSQTSPFYQTLGEAFRASQVNADGTPLSLKSGSRFMDQPCGTQAMADWLTKQDVESGTGRSPWKAGEMTGYASSNAGFPSNMQPALAYATDSGIPNAAKAWQIFNSRSVKPDYQNGPQFNIIPR